MNLDDALQTFIVESLELLDGMEAALLLLEEGSQSDVGEAVNAIFRAAHTIKGSAGLFGLDHVVAFTHVAESVLDELRAGRLAVGAELVALLLSCCDHMRALIERLAAGHVEPDPGLQAQAEPLLAALHARLEASGAGATAAPAAHAASAPSAGTVAGCWQLSLRFGEGVLRNGMDPMSFLRYLSTIGEVRRLVTLDDALPPAAAMDPESCYLGFEVELHTQADAATIESVFEFVRDDCTLQLVPPAGPSMPDAARPAAEGSSAAAAPAPLADTAMPDAGEAAGAAGPARPKASEARSRENQSVRVDADKLDRLVDLVGELVIASAGAGLASQRFADPALQEAHSTLASLVQEVRDSALALRMVKIGASFQRFQRVVRDISHELGKDIGLVIKGEDTELDKTVVEKITDPLTHLVRNAMDHGIGLPEVRIARGKPVRGTITLNAFHDAGQVVIQVSDDGNGMDPARLRAKAVERGLIAADQVLSDSEAYNLVFEPGFSTAETVTNLSGRGVGMDVVKRNITALRGTVEIHSQHAVGTTVTVRLPLTLAIIDGFQVAVGDSVFVVPLDMVEECVEYRPTAQDAGDGRAEHGFTDLRGEVLPLIRLRATFDLGGTPGARQNVVVLRHAGQKVGLVVDRLLGEAQTVIKPLSSVFAHVKGISGSSIRGSGDVALILDVPALIQQASRTEAAGAPAAPLRRSAAVPR